MSKKSYFVGVRFTKDKQLFNKLKNHSESNSALIRKALHHYFDSIEKENGFDGSANSDLIKSLNQQIFFLQEQISFLQRQNAYLSLPWYRKVFYQLGAKQD